LGRCGHPATQSTDRRCSTVSWCSEITASQFDRPLASSQQACSEKADAAIPVEDAIWRGMKSEAMMSTNTMKKV
jgi:hypothetical protein